MTNLTSAEQAQELQNSCEIARLFRLRKLAQDYITVLVERDRLRSELASKDNAYRHAKNDAENHWKEVLHLRAELANCQQDLAAGVKEGKAAIEAYRVEKARLDWLSENLAYLTMVNPLNNVMYTLPNTGRGWKDNHLREAIDAEMKEQSSND